MWKASLVQWDAKAVRVRLLIKENLSMKKWKCSTTVSKVFTYESGHGLSIRAINASQVLNAIEIEFESTHKEGYEVEKVEIKEGQKDWQKVMIVKMLHN